MIEKYVDSTGADCWVVYVNIRSQHSGLRIQRKTKGVKTEVQAKKLELQLIRECERELLIKESKGISWNELLEKFELHQRLDFSNKMTEQTKADYVATIRKHTQSWMGREASGLTPSDIRELFIEVSAQVRTQHQIKMKSILTKIFKYGIESNLIKGMAILPTAGLKFQKEEEKPPEILTISEIRKLLYAAKEMDHKWYPVWAFALLTGMRNGEIFALLWDDIDMENKIIVLSKSYNKRTKTTKCTKAGYWRHIPISSELEALLKELKLKSNGNAFVLPRLEIGIKAIRPGN